MSSDPDLAFAFGEERVLRSVSRGALWLTTLLFAAGVLVYALLDFLPYTALALFYAPGPLFGAYAVFRGAGLVPTALAAGAPVFAAVCATVAAGLFDPGYLAAPPGDLTLVGYAAMGALWWGIAVVLAALLGTLVRLVAERV